MCVCARQISLVACYILQLHVTLHITYNKFVLHLNAIYILHYIFCAQKLERACA